MNGKDELASSGVDLNGTPPSWPINSIIGWLKERRREQPAAPLSQLLQERPVQEECLVDLACIDLMERRRNDPAVCVEDYLKDLPALVSDAVRLDLIDAEICVDRELGKSADDARYADRFPDLAAEIDELLRMDPLGRVDLLALPTDRRQDNDRRHDIAELDTSGQSLEFSLAPGLPSKAGPPSDAGQPSDDGAIVARNAKLPNAISSAASSHPINIPEWFVGERCVASGPGHWLIRGRDAQHGETLAMKVIELPVQITAAQVDEILDQCERAAKVRHRAWVIPAVAAVQQRHLAVVRPWIFAEPWQQFSHNLPPAPQLKHLATIAYALQSAHRVGAAHGAVQTSNILVDHEGNSHLVDCCSGKHCVRRWLGQNDHLANWISRQALDVQDMIRLVVSDAVAWPRDWADRLLSQLRGLAEEHGEEACGRMGDALMRWADREPDDSTSTSRGIAWPRRIAKWISRESQ